MTFVRRHDQPKAVCLLVGSDCQLLTSVTYNSEAIASAELGIFAKRCFLTILAKFLDTIRERILRPAEILLQNRIYLLLFGVPIPSWTLFQYLFLIGRECNSHLYFHARQVILPRGPRMGLFSIQQANESGRNLIPYF